MANRTKRKKREAKKPSLKRAAQKLAKTIWKHLVELPEEERERDIAAIERAVKRKFKQLTRK